MNGKVLITIWQCRKLMRELYSVISMKAPSHISASHRDFSKKRTSFLLTPKVRTKNWPTSKLNTHSALSRCNSISSNLKVADYNV